MKRNWRQQIQSENCGLRTWVAAYILHSVFVGQTASCPATRKSPAGEFRRSSEDGAWRPRGRRPASGKSFLGSLQFHFRNTDRASSGTEFAPIAGTGVQACFDGVKPSPQIHQRSKKGVAAARQRAAIFHLPRASGFLPKAATRNRLVQLFRVVFILPVHPPTHCFGAAIPA